MRVLHVVPTWWPATRYGGTIVSTRALCHALVRGGDTVEVLTTPVDGAQDSAVPLDRDVDDLGIAVRYCRSRLLRRLYWSPVLARELRVRSPLAEVMHAHSVFLWPTWAAVRAAAAAGKPCVLSPRGMLVRSLIAARSSLAKRAWIGLIEQHNLRRAAAIHVTSEHERDALIELGLGPLRRIAVIPNGVDVFPLSGVPPQPGCVLFVGRLSAEKGIERLLAAIARVPTARLELVGPDSNGLQASLQRLAASLQIAQRTRFVGARDAEGVREAMARCSLLVLPSHSENFGNVVTEAMAAGRPVVVTPEVGAGSVVRAAAAGLIAGADAESLAAAIQRLLEHPLEATAMGAAGRDYVRRELSWDVVAGRMRELYADVAAAARHR